MADDWDRQRDIAAEGQRAALYYQRQDAAQAFQDMRAVAAAAQADVARLLEDGARLRSEVASLRLTLGGRTFSATVPEPIGCPMPGACAQVAEIDRLRQELAEMQDDLDAAHRLLGLAPYPLTA